jgi:hypothetical protein
LSIVHSFILDFAKGVNNPIDNKKSERGLIFSRSPFRQSFENFLFEPATKIEQAINYKFPNAIDIVWNFQAIALA